jgi:UDP-N-acetylglucosamine--N-acetylmuramyl-(pentapeptide) pyrophosphoryl-undecaprenol N-acetylglucosamine transferase
MVEEIGAIYKDLNLPAQAKSFISDMAGAYRQADLAIARAGALTLAELVAAKLPAILVPLPTAAGDHQTVNAGAIEKLGLARVVLEKDLVGGELETIVLELLRHPEQLKAMSQKAVEESRKAAAVGPKMAELCLEVMKEKALSQNQTPDQD